MTKQSFVALAGVLGIGLALAGCMTGPQEATEPPDESTKETTNVTCIELPEEAVAEPPDEDVDRRNTLAPDWGGATLVPAGDEGGGHVGYVPCP